MFEKFADRVGRNIRYGEPPLRPNDSTDGAIKAALAVAGLVDVFERIERAAPEDPEVPDMRRDITRGVAILRQVTERLEPGSH